MIVGCGVISVEWLDALKERTDCVVTAMVDINRETAEKRRQEYGLSCPVYTDFDRALQEVKPDIVFDLAYPGAHCEITLKSLRTGCHVFGEKPMCMNRQEGELLLKEVEKGGPKFNVMQNRRFLPAVRALRHAVQSGMLGNIWMVNCEIYVNADLNSVRNQLPYPMLQDQAIHSFDSARFILGADAKDVYCHSYNPPGSHYHGDGCGACIFQMENGTVLVYNAVMDTNVCKTAWHSQWRVIGERGTALWNGFDAVPTAEFFGEDKKIRTVSLEVPKDWNQIPWFAGALDEMLSALKEGQESESSCMNNYGSVAMTFSAIESAKSGQRVLVKQKKIESR